VSYYPIKVGIRAVEGNNHPSLVELGEPCHALGNQVGNHVGLLEVCRGAVDDQRDFTEDVVVKLILQNLVAFLRQVSGNLGYLLFLGVEVDIEMLRSQNMPLEVSIVNLILPEIVLGKGISPKQKNKNQSQGYQSDLSHNRSPSILSSNIYGYSL